MSKVNPNFGNVRTLVKAFVTDKPKTVRQICDETGLPFYSVQMAIISLKKTFHVKNATEGTSKEPATYIRGSGRDDGALTLSSITQAMAEKGTEYMRYELKDKTMQKKLDKLTGGHLTYMLQSGFITELHDDSGKPVLKVEFGPTVGQSHTRKFALVFEKDEIQHKEYSNGIEGTNS